jgi:CRISPR-associated protein Csb2
VTQRLEPDAHEQSPRARGLAAVWPTYADPEAVSDRARRPDPPRPVFGRSVFGDWLVLREIAAPGGGALGLGLATTEDVTRALRGALLRHADDPPPTVLSGHEPDGRPLARPHVAFLALPALDAGEPTGAIGGVAIALPRDIEASDLQAILLAAARWERSGLRLTLGRLGAMQLERCDGPGEGGAPPDLSAWTGPARRWASVTPVALDRNPGDLTSPDPSAAARSAEEIVTRGCAHICLPPPTRVRVMRRSRFPAAPPAPAFMPFPRRASGKLKRVCVHVELEFAEPVAGPVVLGVGRYAGVGLCGRYGRLAAYCRSVELRQRRSTQGDER